jgi:hypothetical protein
MQLTAAGRERSLTFSPPTPKEKRIGVEQYSGRKVMTLLRCRRGVPPTHDDGMPGCAHIAAARRHPALQVAHSGWHFTNYGLGRHQPGDHTAPAAVRDLRRIGRRALIMLTYSPQRRSQN